MTFTDYIKYLGLYNPQNVSQYVEINRLKRLEKKNELDVNKWVKMPLSLWGKINVIKMNVSCVIYDLSGIPMLMPNISSDR